MKLDSAFQIVLVPTSYDEEGLPLTYSDKLHVNVSLGYTGNPELPYYVVNNVLQNPDGSPGPDLTPFILDPGPKYPRAVFSGVDTLFLVDNDEGQLAEALSAWIMPDEMET